MPLRHHGFVDLPVHVKPGGFDHAAVHAPTGRIYVAHTANDAVDIIDTEARQYLGSIGNLTGVAGALVAPGPDLVLTSNRGENTVGIVRLDDVASVHKIAVGVRPNGLAYDARRVRLLVAHVGDPAIAGSCTVSIVDVRTRQRIADVPVAGRTRWAVYDPIADVYHVNIADPPAHRCHRGQ
jgi:DNA-binding beta-propeller fold protein YncE